MNNETILEVRDIAKGYKNVKAVDNVSFAVRSGQIIGLLGPNGAGKTTTINMILGIVEPSFGSVEIFGKDMHKCRSEISEKINFAAVYCRLPPNLTVWQNLYMFGLLYSVKNIKEKIKELLFEFDLERFSNTKSGLLSSGELSRLNIAKAVINSPQLLLLDEPTASLDPSVSQHIREKIKEYVKKLQIAVLWTSHNMKEIESVCDEVLFLSHGKVLLSGNPKTLPAEYKKNDLEELFIAVAREPLTLEG
jgi:ABC-2 type transport system ATP-binding protein